MRFILYLLRWQLSTPILAFAMVAFDDLGICLSTIIANLIGGTLFYLPDKYLFTKKVLDKQV